MGLTPAMKQYMDIKKRHKDCIIFFRMGDFYETFYEDAKIASKVLEITLTKRGIKNSDKSIPLAGIPYHSLNSYLKKMIKNGYKVALVEQLEDPKKAKGVVKRGVVRIVSPGTVLEEEMVPKQNNFIASVFKGDFIGLSFIDISTGDFSATQLDQDRLHDELRKFSPAELVLPISMEDSALAKALHKEYYITFRDEYTYFHENAQEFLQKKMGTGSLDGFGLKEKPDAVSSAGALLSYVEDTQKRTLAHLNNIKYYSAEDNMVIDSSTANNLELFKGESLFSVIDQTQTAKGSRMLRQFLTKPLKNKGSIELRLHAVEELHEKLFLLEELRELLKNISDLERLLSRINFGSATPRDLLQLQGSLELVPDFLKILKDCESALLVKLGGLKVLKEVTSLIDESIMDDPPATTSEGNFIKPGYNESLDRYRRISSSAKTLIKEIQEEEREKTGIKSLKIRYNKVFGYYIDVTKSNLSLVPGHYVKKQTLVNSERFITDELKELESEILDADENKIRIEQELFSEIISELSNNTKDIQDIADKLGYLDVICNLAKIAMMNNYTKPAMNTGFRLKLNESRHPIVEKITDFVPNDINMDVENRMMILTGPNMAGKSIYMKQAALIIIMAHIGSFVPCAKADIPITDKIFSRAGASDDISSGKSTFMVEMTETAYILNNATEKSFVILDEIGRGTSTYDGVAIAWAVVEHIAKKIQCKTLFATHYHVLNNLEKEIAGIKNYNIAVEESKDRIIFLRKVLEGGTDKSYGIHVAKIAGIPKTVIQKSRELQFKLEKEDEITEKIIVETRKSEQKDDLREEIEETDRMIKSRQLRLDQL